MSYDSSVRLGHCHREPHAAQAVDTGQGIAGGDRHSGPHAQLLQHATYGAGQRQHRLRLATAFHLSDQCLRHAGQAQALAGGRQQLGVACAPEREELLLGCRPLRDQQVDQGRLSLEHIPWCAGMDPFDEAGAACLQHGHFPLVEGQHTAHFQAGGQRSLANGRQTQAEILAQAGVDGDGGGGGARAFICIAGDQFHIHEGRFAGLVELLLRVHRVVPIQHLALIRRRGCGLSNSAGHSLLAMLGVPVAACQTEGNRQPTQQRAFPESCGHGWFSP
ncbi:hypothetical protein D9M69_526180 [compost metagenome]